MLINYLRSATHRHYSLFSEVVLLSITLAIHYTTIPYIQAGLPTSQNCSLNSFKTACLLVCKRDIYHRFLSTRCSFRDNFTKIATLRPFGFSKIFCIEKTPI